ncbi:MAG TPA: cysteine desulfurase NifS [Candidatus Faecicola pullistercoris]|nr:cysteine desulfurase NifS [Candidatus Faecicola pullistercoris]
MKVYLDHAATTYTDERVFEKMKPYYTELFGNANSQHFYGRQTEQAVSEARAQVAQAINAKPNEIYFTSGGSEADNWALKGILSAYKSKGNHIITTKIEHAAIMSCCKQLEREGAEITYLDVDENGIVDLKQLENSIRDTTVLVSVMTANNEIGTIEPIEEVVKIAHAKGVLVHTDAVQAAGTLDIDVKAWGVDLLSLSAHKFYGPKGIGALYVRNGVKIARLINGGEQERGLRGGTTNTPCVVGMGEALSIAVAEREANNKKICELRDRFVSMVESEIPFVKYNGDRKRRLPGNANFSFRYIEGESILFSLDMKGIAASSGSACSSGSLEASHTLLAIGVEEGLAHGSIRFSFGKDNTAEQVDYTVSVLKEVVERLRKMSPLFKVQEEYANV